MFPNPQQIKKIFFMTSCMVIAICITSLSAPANAEAVYDGFYLGGLGGLAVTPNYSVNSTVSDITGLSGTVNYFRPFTKNSPYDVGFNIGYKYGPFRYEVEGLFMFSGYKSFSVNSNNLNNTTNFSGSTKTYGALVNIFYNFDTSGDNSYFYLGVGSGYGKAENKLSTTTINITDQGTSGFAMQGIAGYAFNLSSSMSIDFDYRYFIMLQKSQIRDNRYQNHTFNLGLNFYFGDTIS